MTEEWIEVILANMQTERLETSPQVTQRSDSDSTEDSQQYKLTERVDSQIDIDNKFREVIHQEYEKLRCLENMSPSIQGDRDELLSFVSIGTRESQSEVLVQPMEKYFKSANDA